MSSSSKKRAQKAAEKQQLKQTQVLSQQSPTSQMISTQESPPDAAKKQRSRVSFDIAKDDEIINVRQDNDDGEAGAASSDPDVSDDSTSKVQNDARSQQQQPNQFVMPSPRYNDIGFHQQPTPSPRLAVVQHGDPYWQASTEYSLAEDWCKSGYTFFVLAPKAVLQEQCEVKKKNAMFKIVREAIQSNPYLSLYEFRAASGPNTSKLVCKGKDCGFRMRVFTTERKKELEVYFQSPQHIAHNCQNHTLRSNKPRKVFFRLVDAIIDREVEEQKHVRFDENGSNNLHDSYTIEDGVHLWLKLLIEGRDPQCLKNMLWKLLARCPLGDVDKVNTAFNTAKHKEYKPSELLSDAAAVSASKKKKRGRKAPAPPSAATVTYVQQAMVDDYFDNVVPYALQWYASLFYDATKVSEISVNSRHTPEYEEVWAEISTRVELARMKAGGGDDYLPFRMKEALKKTGKAGFVMQKALEGGYSLSQFSSKLQDCIDNLERDLVSHDYKLHQLVSGNETQPLFMKYFYLLNTQKTCKHSLVESRRWLEQAQKCQSIAAFSELLKKTSVQRDSRTVNLGNLGTRQQQQQPSQHQQHQQQLQQ